MKLSVSKLVLLAFWVTSMGAANSEPAVQADIDKDLFGKIDAALRQEFGKEIQSIKTAQSNGHAIVIVRLVHPPHESASDAVPGMTVAPVPMPPRQPYREPTRTERIDSSLKTPGPSSASSPWSEAGQRLEKAVSDFPVSVKQTKGGAEIFYKGKF